MKKTLLFFALPFLFFTQCKTLRVSDFHAKAPVNERLPRMGMQVHQESFAAAFDRETFAKGWNGNVAIPGSAGPNEYFALSDLPLEDVFAAFGNEVNENLVENRGERYGNIRFKLLNYDRRAPGWGYQLASWATLNTLNVAGMPHNRYRAELELQVEITDIHKKVIARYSAPGSGRAYVAMYYGYRPGDAWRKANLLALQEAMKVIRPKIEADAGDLRKKLLETGSKK